MREKGRTSQRASLALVIAALSTALAFLLVFQRFLFLPKIVMVLLIMLAAWLLGKFGLFMKDWFVFIAFIYLFDSLRGIIYILTCKLSLPVHTLYVLKAEKALFGGIPSVFLQNLLLRPDPAGNFSWLEKTLTVFYGSHFIAFLLVGWIIWLYRRETHSLYTAAFYFLMSLGILFYAIAPTVPPWMASDHFGLIPPLTRFNTILFNFAIPDISGGFDTNPIAAMPSLHAAFPILCSFLLWDIYRWKAAAFHVYTLIILFTIVYTGDHYVMDVIAGLALAVACYWMARKIHAGRLIKPAGGTEPDRGAPPGRGVLNKRILMGLGVFFVGIVIGSVNKTQFLLHSSSYNLDVPRYADFFKNESLYRDNYRVQAYFGGHSLARRDYRKALACFEKAAELAGSAIEANETQMKINFCRRMLRKEN